MQNDALMLSKGFYQYAQLSQFITVKNYIFVRQNGKKCLLLRFYNDMDYTVDAIYFTIVQMDAAGKELERTSIACERLSFRSGSNHTLKNAIVVEELCNDFKIVFDEVHAGRYSYVVKDGKAVAYFNAEQKKKPRRMEDDGDSSDDAFTVKKKKYGRPAIAAFLAVLLLLALIALNAFQLYFAELKRYEENKNRVWSAAQTITDLMLE